MTTGSSPPTARRPSGTDRSPRTPGAGAGMRSGLNVTTCERRLRRPGCRTADRRSGAASVPPRRTYAVERVVGALVQLTDGVGGRARDPDRAARRASVKEASEQEV